MTSTTSRLLLLLSLLQTRRDWPGRVLAERLQITDRTVRRDVDRLREMGYRIQAVKGPDGGYRLEAGSDLPPLLFDDDQAIAIAVALRAATVAGAGIEEAAVRALTTVRQVMPARLRHHLDALQFTSLPPDRLRDSASPDVLIVVSAAIRAREVLRFDYSSLQAHPEKEESARRRVEPHHLVTANGLWYLVAWDLSHDDWRIFRADRISPRTPTGPRFGARSIPGENVHDFVSARFKGSETSNSWPCMGTVILHLPARDVLPFAGDGTVEDLGPDRCSYESGSWSWAALAASLGRFDADLEVVQPRELAESFHRLSTRFAAVGSS
ncbi:helix-turn-helix transcriptional regulator [Mycetocola zhadangensis]|uniref:helix-turn-helix transcriptional regulator n=1 Tax=Mycetocola zhadangensis TaxID=1164595 RepID=UPI003A4D83CB